MATKGFTTPEAKQMYSRARALCEQVADSPQLFPVLRGLFWTSLVPGEYHAAHKVGQQMLALAESLRKDILLAEAHSTVGLSSFWLGELTAAHTQVEQGITCYDPQSHRSQTVFYLTDPGVLCLSYAAFTLWQLGYPDQALQRCQDTLRLARELSHPHSLAHALLFFAFMHQMRRENTQAQERLTAAVTLSAEQGFPHWLAVGDILRGWLLSQQGQKEEGITLASQGLILWQTTGAKLWTSWCLVLLAETYYWDGQTNAGLAALEEALVVVEEAGERVWEAELYRLKGELTLQAQVSGEKATIEEALEYFHQAIAIAHRQSAKSLELRAVMSLSRLWQRQGKQKEAHALLSEIYGWFTEGFDTKDLQEAKALLEALG